MGLVKMYVHRLWVLSRRSSDELGHCLPIGGLHKLIDDNVGFELGLNLVDVLDRDVLDRVERGSSVGRMPDSQSREPGFESPLIPFRSLGIFFHFTMPQSTQLYT